MFVKTNGHNLYNMNIFYVALVIRGSIKARTEDTRMDRAKLQVRGDGDRQRWGSLVGFLEVQPEQG